ncbi:guanylate kinase [Celerinatantimonas diazotrophica]|uniref:guanylate kinase n=1 Tax=Celerinatantimonas diazotrophica TaxID=412034 RepID=UPI001404ECCB|nr:guanylate kinase [Celerinatantimonas diazotrophica]
MAKGTLYIVSAPSGAGKSSMINALINRNPNLPIQVSISHTTRAPRPGEESGAHYHFVSKEQFEELIAQNAFFEYAEVFGQYYGTSKMAIEQTLTQGIDVFLDIDWQGARQVREQMNDAVSVFILPPSSEELENRLKMRGQDSQEVIRSRMRQAKAEMSHYDEYDYLIINEDFDHAVTQLQAILQCHRLRQSAQALKYQTIIQDLLVNEPEID